MALCLRLELKGKNCAIFGGGKEGLRRATQLLAQGANVVAYSPLFCKEWQQSQAVCICQPYHISQLDKVFFAAAATNDPNVNQQIVADCLQKGVVVISSTQADTPFHPMANRSWSNGTVAVSVPQAPSLAAKIAAQMEEQAENNYAEQAEKMAKLRRLAQKNLPYSKARELMQQAVEMPASQLEKIIVEMQEE